MDIVETLERRVNIYWNFYTFVVIAVVGWIITAKIQFTFLEITVLTFVLIVFFQANYTVITSATKRIIVFENELLSLLKKTKFLSEKNQEYFFHTIIRNRIRLSTRLHIVVDIAVIFIIMSKAL